METTEYNLLLAITRPIDRWNYGLKRPMPLLSWLMQRSAQRIGFLNLIGARETWAQRFNRRWQARQEQQLRDIFAAKGINY